MWWKENLDGSTPMVLTVSSLELLTTYLRLCCPPDFRSLESYGPTAHPRQRAWAVLISFSYQKEYKVCLAPFPFYNGSQQGAALFPCRPKGIRHLQMVLFSSSAQSRPMCHSLGGSFCLSIQNTPAKTRSLCFPILSLNEGDRFPFLPDTWPTVVEDLNS